MAHQEELEALQQETVWMIQNIYNTILRNSTEIKDLLHEITGKTKDSQQGIMNQKNKIQ